VNIERSHVLNRLIAVDLLMPGYQCIDERDSHAPPDVAGKVEQARSIPRPFVSRVPRKP
jgi:hypothetical protein